MQPDIVSCGKGIGNGYPVSVIAMTKSVAELAEKSTFRYAQSHQNDPLGCAVVKEVLSIIEENNLIQRAVDIGAFFESELKSLLYKHACIKTVRGVGLMLVMEFHENKGFSLENIHRELFDSGYIVGVNPLANVLRFYPPLTIEKGHIKSMAGNLDCILSKNC